jgi:hypothetical protein
MGAGNVDREGDLLSRRYAILHVGMEGGSGREVIDIGQGEQPAKDPVPHGDHEHAERQGVGKA